MKRILFFAAVGLLVITGACSVHINKTSVSFGGDLKFATNITQKAELPAGLKAIAVENQFGILRITGNENGSGDLDWKLKIHARTEALAQQAATNATVRMVRDGDRLEIIVWLPKSNGGLSFESDLEVRAPKSIAVSTENHFGSTLVSDFGGDVEASGENGSVEISKVVGKVHAKTSFATMKVSDVGPANLRNQNGSIDASDIRGPLDATTSFATLSARNVGGPVKLRNQNGLVEVTKANDVDIKTSFAELKVRDINGNVALVNQNGSIKGSGINGDVKAITSFATMDITSSGKKFVCRNQNGELTVHAISPSISTIDAETSFATMEVQLPSKLKPAIQARTSFAEVESDFPVLLKPRNRDAFADVAPETPRITLQNQNGAIRIVGK